MIPSKFGGNICLSTSHHPQGPQARQVPLEPREGRAATPHNMLPRPRKRPSGAPGGMGVRELEWGSWTVPQPAEVGVNAARTDDDAGSKTVVAEVMSGDVDASNAARQVLDINFDALIKLASQGKAVEDGLLLAERALELRRKYEDQRVENFRAITQAVIAAKKEDPDEIDRLETNKFRRGLMSIVALCAMAFTAATIGVGVSGGSIAAFGGLLSLTTLSLIMLAVLATGGQLTVRNLSGLAKTLSAMQQGADDAKSGKAGRNRGRKKP